MSDGRLNRRGFLAGAVAGMLALAAAPALAQDSRILRAGQVAPFSSEAEALFARMSTPPTAARKILINALISALISAGVWNRLDALYLTAAADAQAASLNWLSSSFPLVVAGTPTFTADRGWLGNGVDGALSTGFNPTSARGVKYGLNSAHIMAYSLTPGFGNGTLMAVSGANSAGIEPKYDATNGYYWMQGFSGDIDNAIPNQSGMHSVTITRGDNTVRGYYNGAVLPDTDPTSGAGIANANFMLLTDAAGAFASLNVAAASIGAGLNAANELALYNAILAYLQGVGAA